MISGTSTGRRVTLVISVLNHERQLAEMFDSVRLQEPIRDAEVIVVDRGSTDASGSFVNAFLATHKNARMVKGAGLTLGGSRSLGARLATRPAVAFLSGDSVMTAESFDRRLRSFDDLDVLAGSRGRRVVPANVEVEPELREAHVIRAAGPRLSVETSIFSKRWLGWLDDAKGELETDDAMILPLVTAPRVRLLDGRFVERAKADDYLPQQERDSLRVTTAWSQLKIADLIMERIGGFSEPAQTAIRAQLIKTMCHHLINAPRAMTVVDGRKFFERASAVFAAFDPDEIRAATSTLAHRIAFVAMASENLGLFLDRWSHAAGLEEIQGAESLKVVPRPDGPAVKLLKVTSPKLLLERFDSRHSERVVRFSGRLELPGVPTPGLEEQVRVRISAAGTPLCESVQVRVRSEASADTPRTVLEWICHAPANGVPEGVSTLDGHVFIEGGRFTIRLRPTLGLLRRNREVRTRSTRSLLLPTVDDRIQLLTRRNTAHANRAKWAWLLAKRDLLAIKRSQPFAWTRLLRLLTKPLSWGRPIWLLTERGDTAQDNGFRFFQWARKNAHGARVYYVLKRSSPAWHSIGNHRAVVPYGSVRHCLAMLHARVLVSSQDIDGYMLPPSWDRREFRLFLAPRLAQRRVFLQHGVTCNGVSRQLASDVLGVDLLVTSSPKEHSYIESEARYGSELAQTGMPRFDSLHRIESNRIVIMPTWRRYLVLPSYTRVGKDPGTFSGSRYERFYSALLSSSRLESVLEKHDVFLTFAPHYEVARHFNDASSSSRRIEVVANSGTRVQEYIATARVLVTDYSSVMFDAAYLGTPVLQLPFDLEEFHERHYPRGWFDNGGGEFWPVARTVDDAISELDRILSDGARTERQYRDHIEELFPLRDRQNSRRVYEAIQALT